MNLVLYFLAAFGLAYIVGHSAISMPLRLFIAGPSEKPRVFFTTLIELIECPACLGTWIGLIVGGLEPSLFLQSWWLMGALAGGCATAGVNFLLATWAGLIGDEDPAEAHMKGMLMHVVQRQLMSMQEDPEPAMDPIHEQPPSDTFTEHDERQLDLLKAAPHPLDQNGPLGVTDDKAGI